MGSSAVGPRGRQLGKRADRGLVRRICTGRGGRAVRSGQILRRYLRSLKKAADEGIPVLGYQYWSILDNFEWCSGYDMHFGLVYVDYLTQKRTVKDSAWVYRDIIRTNGNML